MTNARSAAGGLRGTIAASVESAVINSLATSAQSFAPTVPINRQLTLMARKGTQMFYSGLGVAIIIAAASVGFIQVSDADYQKWRLIFAAGEGLALSIGIMLVLYGIILFHNTPKS